MVVISNADVNGLSEHEKNAESEEEEEGKLLKMKIIFRLLCGSFKSLSSGERLSLLKPKCSKALYSMSRSETLSYSLQPPKNGFCFQNGEKRGCLCPLTN